MRKKTVLEAESRRATGIGEEQENRRRKEHRKENRKTSEIRNQHNKGVFAFSLREESSVNAHTECRTPFFNFSYVLEVVTVRIDM